MINKLLTCLLLGLCYQFAHAQPVTWIQGARYAGLANASVADSTIGNVSGNPAGIAGIGRPQVLLSYESRFRIEELSTRALAFVFPYQRQVFGWNVNFYGTDSYNEQLVSLNYARRFSERFSAGIRFNYHGLKIPEYTSQTAWSVAAGIQFKLLHNLAAGLQVSNPNQASFDRDLQARLPVFGEIGLLYAFSGKFIAVAAVQKAVGYRPDLKTGLEYRIHRLLAVRGGISTEPFKQYFGLGLSYRQWMMDMAASSHPILGFSPQVSLGYEF